MTTLLALSIYKGRERSNPYDIYTTGLPSWFQPLPGDVIEVGNVVMYVWQRRWHQIGPGLAVQLQSIVHHPDEYQLERSKMRRVDPDDPRLRYAYPMLWLEDDGDLFAMLDELGWVKYSMTSEDQPCDECEGHGIIPEQPPFEMVGDDCEACEGTGQNSRKATP